MSFGLFLAGSAEQSGQEGQVCVSDREELVLDTDLQGPAQLEPRQLHRALGQLCQVAGRAGRGRGRRVVPGLSGLGDPLPPGRLRQRVTLPFLYH